MSTAAIAVTALLLAACIAPVPLSHALSFQAGLTSPQNHLGGHVKELEGDETTLPGAPRLVQQPRAEYYVTPKSPATIECAADHASYVTVHCNGKALEKKIEVNMDHERPERRRFHVGIEFSDVHKWFGSGSYYCNCEAWNQMPAFGNQFRKVVSSRGYIKIAYFESDAFQFSPVPMNVSLDANNVLLSCTPPMGNPKPKVSWLKDDKPLNLTYFGDRITIDHQDQLIIRPLRLQDSGNYSCVAQIPGQFIKSRSARLTIHVNGGWSAWSLRHDCDPSCGGGAATACPQVCFSQRRIRRRFCNSPEPLHGGRYCEGENSQAEACSSGCRVNGQWGDWSGWGVCTADCVSVRRRLCNNPSPSNGGLACPAGEDDDAFAGGRQLRNCTGGQLCKSE